MKIATAKELKQALNTCNAEELEALCLRLARFKKENKELLTYLLFEAENEDAYIENVKAEIDAQFAAINTSSGYFIKKSVRKILSAVKKHIRYSQQKETEIALLLYFCAKLKRQKPSYKSNTVLVNTYNTQLKLINKKLLLLDEDLQYDYARELEALH